MPTFSRPLHPALAPLVASLVGYDYRLPADAVHRGLPSTSATVVIALDEPLDCGWLDDETSSRFWTLIGGLHVRPALIRTHGHQVGLQVALTPLGLRALTGAPAGEYTRQLLDEHDLALLPAGLHERLQEADWRTRFELVEEVLLRRLAGADAELRPELARAWDRLTGGTIAIAALADEVGWSRRHLLNQVRAEFGLDPRTIRRLGRFERARALAQRNASLADVAARCGYADQAHLTRDWRALAGVTPRATLAEFPTVQEPLD
ncbi:helix-turn-helix domain-containing protein [Micropruina sp.]|uniref:helix-turn-helix domain-containing protein n=1 Tax=Micropruina sp. TaxID=2737536 RepID=UPI0039E2BBF1